MKHNRLNQTTLIEMKATKKILIIVLLTIIWSHSAYSNNELTKKPKSDLADTELYRDIEFTSQDAILRGEVVFTREQIEKKPGCYHGTWIYNYNKRNDS